MEYLEGQAWRKLEGSLKDYCPIIIVKEESDREYKSRVLVQDFLLYLLYLYVNMVHYIIFEYFKMNIVDYIQYIV
jgi:hypothetical protein